MTEHFFPQFRTIPYLSAALLAALLVVSCAPHRSSVPAGPPPTATVLGDPCPQRCAEPPAPAPAPEKPIITPVVVPETAEPPAAPLPDEYELLDVRTLPQDMSAYASSVAGVISPACRDNLTAEFRKRYFSTWDGGGPQFDPSEMLHAMKQELAREWFGENRRRVPLAVLAVLRENSDLGHLPSLNRRAITVAATNMRVLPTTRPLFKQADSFPFDMLQQTGVKLNEPLRVLHRSRDGLWVFAETSYANGWIETRDIAYLDDTAAQWRRNAEQIVIVKDFTPVQDSTGTLVRNTKIGTIFPLARETEDFFEVYLAARSEQTGAMVDVAARIPKEVARRHPLEFTDKTLTLIGNQLIGTPYGWGELFDDRDCSAMIRDYLLPFGIWLPRGSYNQTHAGTTISLAGKSPGEKERIILEKGVPFLTLVWLKGHIMLYVGARNGKPLVFHDLWGVTVKDRDGKDRKQIVGKAVVTTLSPGSELPLASGPLLAKLGKIRIVTDLCAGPGSR